MKALNDQFLGDPKNNEHFGFPKLESYKKDERKAKKMLSN